MKKGISRNYKIPGVNRKRNVIEGAQKATSGIFAGKFFTFHPQKVGGLPPQRKVTEERKTRGGGNARTRIPIQAQTGTSKIGVFVMRIGKL